MKDAEDEAFDDLARKQGMWGGGFQAKRAAAADKLQEPAQEPVAVDATTMELAESVGLIGPASRTHDLHAAIQRFHDLICANATLKAAKMAADAISEVAPAQKPVECLDCGSHNVGTPPQRKPLTDEPEYYLQDTRGYVGNCPLWWAKNGNGYTTDLRKAHRYTLAKAMSQHRCRESDLPWSCEEIDPLQRPTIDVQDMHKIREIKAQRTLLQAAHGIKE